MTFMKKITALCCVLLLFLTGCYLGDRITSQTVSLNFPAAQGQDKVSLAVSDSQVQEALKLIDNVLVSDGFVRDPNPPGANNSSLIASYSKYSGTGPRPIGGPSVYFRCDSLDVRVVQGGHMNAPVSSATKEICNSLRKELSNRFGAQRVKIER